MHPYFDLPGPHLFGHRGASGEAPENTLVAFERAWRQGVRFLETDCHVSADGEVVLIHDPTVERTTDGDGAVAELAWTELHNLDAGYRFEDATGGHPFRQRDVRIPRLAELLEALPAARVNLEIKPTEPAVAEHVVAEVRRCGAEERVLLTSADDSMADAVHALAPKTAFGSSLGDILGFIQATVEDRLGDFVPRGHALQVPPEFMGEPVVTTQSVEAAHRVGLAIHVWTIDEPDEMRRLLALGVDGLMSDYPARLVQVVRELSRS